MDFFCFQISKLSSRVDPGSIAHDCSTPKHLWPGCLPESPSNNHRGFSSSQKNGVWGKITASGEKFLPISVCFGQRKHAATNCAPRETTAGLRQSCLTGQRCAGGVGPSQLPLLPGGISWRPQDWSLQGFSCSRDPCSHPINVPAINLWAAWSRAASLSPQELPWNISAAMEQ